MRGKSYKDASQLLDALGIKYKSKGSTEGIISHQSAILEEYKEGDVIVLTVAEGGDSPVVMPQLKGMSVTQATKLLDSLGLSYEIEGGGVLIEQSVKAGTEVEKGTTVQLKFQYIE